MKKFPLLALLFTLPFCAESQSGCGLFQHIFGSPNTSERAECLAQTPDGGALLGGKGDDLQPILVKTGPTGEFEWAKKYSQTTAGGEALVVDIDLLKNGNWLVAILLTDAGKVPTGCRILRLDPSGNVLAATDFPGHYLVKGSIEPTADGGFVAMPLETPAANSVSILKFDAAGNMAWSTGFSGTGNTQFAADIKQIADGGFLLAGYTNSNASGTYDAFAVRLGPDGSLGWQKKYVGAANDIHYSCDELPGGDLLFSGSNDLGGQPDGFFMRTDAGGQPIYQKTWRASNKSNLAGASQTLTPGGFVLSALDRSFNGTLLNAVFAKFSFDGSPLWSREYGGPDDLATHFIERLPDGKLLLAGTRSLPMTPGQPTTDLFLMKTDSLGLAAGCPAINHQTSLEDLNLMTENAPFSPKTPVLLQAATQTATTFSFPKEVICSSSFVETSDTARICQGDTLFFQNQILTQAGTTDFQFQTAAGCDSTVHLTLEITTDTIFNEHLFTLCFGDSITFNGIVFKTPGTYPIPDLTAQCPMFDVLQIVVNQPITPIIDLADESCPGAADGSFFISNSQPDWLFSMESGPFSASPNGLDSLAPGTYFFEIQDGKGCHFSQSVEVASGNSFALFFPQNVVEIGLGDTLQLVPQFAPSGLNPVDFQWIWSPPAGLSNAESQAPLAVPLENTVWSVTATNVAGCSASASLTVNVIACRDVFFPNAFTPNGDGRNDTFQIFANENCLRRIRRMTIFDRWGQQVFEKLDFQPGISGGWNGRFREKEMPSEVYVWLVELEFLDGKVEVRRGDLTLVR